MNDSSSSCAIRFHPVAPGSSWTRRSQAVRARRPRCQSGDVPHSSDLSRRPSRFHASPAQRQHVRTQHARCHVLIDASYYGRSQLDEMRHAFPPRVSGGGANKWALAGSAERPIELKGITSPSLHDFISSRTWLSTKPKSGLTMVLDHFAQEHEFHFVRFGIRDNG
jgi:hypothetical protein